MKWYMKCFIYIYCGFEIKLTMIIAVMNAIEAIAYRSLKKSGLQRGLNPWPREVITVMVIAHLRLKMQSNLRTLTCLLKNEDLMFCQVVELFIWCHFMLKGNKEILKTITQFYFNNLEFIKESNFLHTLCSKILVIRLIQNLL